MVKVSDADRPRSSVWFSTPIFLARDRPAALHRRALRGR